jgi:integrase
MIALKHLRIDRNRHGSIRIYLRVPGRKQVRLREQPGSAAFIAEYQAALLAAEGATGRKAAGAPRFGTLAWLFGCYCAAPEYRALAACTRRTRELILAPIIAANGDKPFAALEAHHVRALRDARSARPGSANGLIKALRQLYGWACEAGLAKSNPAKEVGCLKPRNPDGFHSWTSAEVERFRTRWPVGTKPRLALELLLYTGVRRSDVVLLGRQMVRDGWLHFTEAKGKAQQPKHRAIPVLPELQAVIDATPSGHMTFLVTEFGKPFTAAGFGNWFRERCNAAGLPHCSAHGLRKAGATIAAENGATEHQLMAIFGWSSPKQAAVYTRAADRRRLAADAMRLLLPSAPLSHQPDTVVPLERKELK